LVLSGPATLAAAPPDQPNDPVRSWTIDFRLQNYFKSHTSYEFGNPFPPRQTPLSRLEFPLDTWWAGVEVRRDFSRFSAGIEVMRNITNETDGVMTDSDWDDDANPQVVTIYSESAFRIEPSYTVRGDLDLKVSDWLHLPPWMDLRPVAGVRWQRFTLVTHDGVQSYPAPGDTTPPVSLPGDGIRFEQVYWQYFIGVRTAFDLLRRENVPRLKLLAQLDWGYVEGRNQDDHLLIQGNRYTYEKTSGDVWHASLGLQYGLTKKMSAALEVTYLRIQSGGTHQLLNNTFGIDMTFDHGVRVWSEQKTVMLSLQYQL
jgi:outer membrane protease